MHSMSLPLPPVAGAALAGAGQKTGLGRGWADPVFLRFRIRDPGDPGVSSKHSWGSRAHQGVLQTVPQNSMGMGAGRRGPLRGGEEGNSAVGRG